MRLTALFMVAALGASASENANKKKHAPKTAVEINAERHIINAIDAGDGDVVLHGLRQKLAADPGDLTARLALAKAYEDRGATELALDHYRIAVDQYGSEAAASRLAQSLDGLGESEQALEVLVRFCGSHPAASSRILSETGILFDEMNQFDSGERYHLRALTAALEEHAPKQDSLHNNLGYNYIQQKRYSDAQRQLRAALELNPHSAVAHNNLAEALASEPGATDEQYKEAILHWQSTAGPSAAHNNLAAVFIEQNRIEDAKRELGLALSFDRNNEAALRNLGNLGVSVTLPAAQPKAKVAFWKRIFPGRWKKVPPGTESAELALRPNLK